MAGEWRLGRTAGNKGDMLTDYPELLGTRKDLAFYSERNPMSFSQKENMM